MVQEASTTALSRSPGKSECKLLIWWPPPSSPKPAHLSLQQSGREVVSSLPRPQSALSNVPGAPLANHLHSPP